MSDELAPPPPALRLKPRLRPADGQAGVVTATTAAPETTSPAVSTDPSPAPAAETVPPAKLRFKPRLDGAPAPAVPENAVPTPSPLTEIPAAVPPPLFANPAVSAPPPPLFVTPPTPPPIPPLFVTDSPPARPEPVAAAPAPAVADLGKFKLKPKVPSAVPPPPGVAGSVPAAFAPPPPVPAAVASPAPAAMPPPMPKAPPPFPVMAPSGAPPMPTGTAPGIAPAPAADGSTAPATPPPPPVPEPRRSGGLGMFALAGLLVVGAAGYFGWKRFMAPPPSAASPKAGAAKAATKNGSASTTTPSETLNKLAHAPAEAINKAQEALATRRASGQARVDAAVNGEEPPDRPPPTKQPAAKTAQTVTTTVAPGVTATTSLDAASEASPGFRSFVANARVSGVFQGSPARAVINGKLTRVGESVDAGLGVTFEGIDASGHNLVFKDRSGATVLRRF